jgi:FAD/FMN-containing dehydrogenase
MHNTAVRLTAGLFLRGSKQYWKIMQWNGRFKFTERIRKITRTLKKESVIQDVQTPLSRSAEFLTFFLKEIPLTPIWICPTRSQSNAQYPLYELDSRTLYINFGFWDVIALPNGESDGFYNRKVEAAIDRLNGQKSLYSTAYYSEKEFWKRYNGKAYAALKKKYDSGNAFLNLYDKTVKRM